MATKKGMTRKEALAALCEAGSHSFLWFDAARNIAAAFGLKVEPQVHVNNPQEFKGLDVPGKRPGEKVEGYAARDLAIDIARHLDPSYRNAYMGRGFAFRGAVEHIQQKMGGAE